VSGQKEKNMSDDRLTSLERRLSRLERQRRASLGLAVLGAAALGVSLTTGTDAQSPSQIRAPFRVVNAQGKDVFTVTQAGAETRVSIVSDNKAVSMWTADSDSSSLSLTSGATSKAMVRLGVNFNGDNTGPSLLMADGAEELLVVEDNNVEINAPLTVAPKGTPVLRVEDTQATVTNALTVRARTGANRTSLGPTSVSVHGGDGASVAASLGLDTVGKGRLVVGAPTGPRGVLGQTADGGVSFALFDAPGTKYRIGMAAAPMGTSFLRLYSGKRQVELDVNPTSGSLHLFNDAGYAAASVDMTPAGNGKLSLGDAAGEALVEAGMTTEGLGVVRAGPGSRPPGPQGPPSALLGRKR
jgi:hypothetical protein